MSEPKRIGAVAALAVVGILLTGCGAGAGGRSVNVVEITRPNGGTVECATNDGGGMDCNWDHR